MQGQRQVVDLQEEYEDDLLYQHAQKIEAIRRTNHWHEDYIEINQPVAVLLPTGTVLQSKIVEKGRWRLHRHTHECGDPSACPTQDDWLNVIEGTGQYDGSDILIDRETRLFATNMDWLAKVHEELEDFKSD